MQTWNLLVLLPEKLDLENVGHYRSWELEHLQLGIGLELHAFTRLTHVEEKLVNFCGKIQSPSYATLDALHYASDPLHSTRPWHLLLRSVHAVDAGVRAREGFGLVDPAEAAGRLRPLVPQDGRGRVIRRAAGQRLQTPARMHSRASAHRTATPCPVSA